jgi:hypothetical protein
MNPRKISNKAGRGPFNTADEMIAHMKAHVKKPAVKKPKRARPAPPNAGLALDCP